MYQRLIPALLMALVAQSGFALGLGELKQQSGLGEPLKAQIPLTEAQEWSSEQFKARLSGISAAATRSVELAVITAGKQRYIQLTTRAPVNEPYVSFTLNLTWPDGSLKRDYELLLDPPAFKQGPSQ
jgi:pilus assembly protein FimV